MQIWGIMISTENALQNGWMQSISLEGCEFASNSIYKHCSDSFALPFENQHLQHKSFLCAKNHIILTLCIMHYAGLMLPLLKIRMSQFDQILRLLVS